MMTSATATRIPATTCPSCRRMLNMTAGPTAPGTVTVCAYCAVALRFGAELVLEPIELEALPPAEADRVRGVVDTVRRRLKAARSRWN